MLTQFEVVEASLLFRFAVNTIAGMEVLAAGAKHVDCLMISLMNDKESTNTKGIVHQVPQIVSLKCDHLRATSC
jgi:hypothetical protein